MTYTSKRNWAEKKERKKENRICVFGMGEIRKRSEESKREIKLKSAWMKWR